MMSDSNNLMISGKTPTRRRIAQPPDQPQANHRPDPALPAREIHSLQLGQPGTERLAAAPASEHGRGMVKEINMTKPVRYQKGWLFQDHGAWFVRYRESVKQKDGTI